MREGAFDVGQPVDLFLQFDGLALAVLQLLALLLQLRVEAQTFVIAVGQQAGQRMQADGGRIGRFQDAVEQAQGLGQIQLRTGMAEHHGGSYLGIRRGRQSRQHHAFAVDLRWRHAVQHLVIGQRRYGAGIIDNERHAIGWR